MCVLFHPRGCRPKLGEVLAGCYALTVVFREQRPAEWPGCIWVYKSEFHSKTFYFSVELTFIVLVFSHKSDRTNLYGSVGYANAGVPSAC